MSGRASEKASKASADRGEREKAGFFVGGKVKGTLKEVGAGKAQCGSGLTGGGDGRGAHSQQTGWRPARPNPGNTWGCALCVGHPQTRVKDVGKSTSLFLSFQEVQRCEQGFILCSQILVLLCCAVLCLVLLLLSFSAAAISPSERIKLVMIVGVVEEIDDGCPKGTEACDGGDEVE